MSTPQTTNITVPRWLWCKASQCVVEVLRIGHFPDSLIVRKPDGREIEMPCTDLEIQESTKR